MSTQTVRDITPLDSAMHLVAEDNPMPVGLHDVERRTVGLQELAQGGGKVTRLRMLSEKVGYGPRLFDVSYVYGEMGNGEPVRVRGLWFSLVARRDIKGEIIRQCKAAGVFAKGLGLLDEGNWSVLY